MCEKLGYTESKDGRVTSVEQTLVLELGRKMPPGRQGQGGPNAPLPLPARCWLTHLQLFGVASEGGEPSGVTWWLALDAAGSQPLTERRDTTWNDAIEGFGGVAQRIDFPWHATLEATSLYVLVQFSLGDDPLPITVRARLFWYTMSDADLTDEHRARLAGAC